MRVLMVGPYPPWRDGIAAYALQSVKRLRAEGHDVEALSPLPSAAQHHLDLAGWRGPLALAKRVAGYDLVVLQFHPDVFYPQGCLPWERIAISLGLAEALRRARRSEVVLHEVDYNRLAIPTQRRAFRRFLLAASTVEVHTEAERGRLARAAGLTASRIQLRIHEGDFVARTRLDRAAARASLGIPQESHVFLCIGFIQPHKGFDRAVRAFAQLGSSAARLYVVGSVRLDEPEYTVHLAELRALVERAPGAQLVTGYLTDELFDRWIVAADTVVLPYRMIWSSSVLGRAAVLGRPVIAADVGGLRDQAPPGTALVASDEELLAAMRRALGEPTGAEGVGAVDTSAPDERHYPTLRGDAPGMVGQLVRERAAEIRRQAGMVEVGDASGSGPRPYDRLVALPPLTGPAIGPSSRGRRFVKLVVHRLTRWEVDPIIRQVNALHAAVLQALTPGGDGKPPV
jgi:glycosyltransferase involved in cell wall biosynthesis